jgi:hypothetical protein
MANGMVRYYYGMSFIIGNIVFILYQFILCSISFYIYIYIKGERDGGYHIMQAS